MALKTLFDARISADLKKEYMDELLVMSRVTHSNIVKFLGACMTPPNLCFIMELCEGSLFNRLHVDRVPLSMQEKYQAAVSMNLCFNVAILMCMYLVHNRLISPVQ